MVPSLVLALEALPSTPNGKLDRRALAALAQRQAGQTGAAPPRTPTEQALAAIWADLLGLAQVGIHDNFFELGGHSVLAIQIVSRIRQEFQIPFELRALFERPTVAQLGESVDGLRWAIEGRQAALAAAQDGEEGEI